MSDSSKVYMVIRHDLSGVWVGEYLGPGILDPKSSHRWRARKIWSWRGGQRLETSQIAARGLPVGQPHKLGDVIEVEIPWGEGDRRCDAALTTRDVYEQICSLPSWEDNAHDGSETEEQVV